MSLNARLPLTGDEDAVSDGRVVKAELMYQVVRHVEVFFVGQSRVCRNGARVETILVIPALGKSDLLRRLGSQRLCGDLQCLRWGKEATVSTKNTVR